MDLNHLLRCEQRALFRADRESSPLRRRRLNALAFACRQRIASREFPGSAIVGAFR